MTRAARPALAAVAAAAAVLLAGAPGALAASPAPSNAPTTNPPTTNPGGPAAGATPGMPKSWSSTCQSSGSVPDQAASSLSGEPWAQQALDFSSVWGLSQGQGVTVAVVDSGVDYDPQLAGRVSYHDLTGTGPADCVGHGTAVASIIAASDERSRGIPFYGVAPAAHILSIKVNTGENGDTALLASGIRDAVDLGAQVINVSIQTRSDTPALRSAVDYALSQDRVVVAAAGNDDPDTGTGPFYPASYPGVLSVAAVDQTGTVISYTDPRTPVSVAAPGANVASDWPGGFSPANVGTSFAAAFVSGEAALIRAAFPSLSAAQVTARVISTADGNIGAHSGAGMINPVEAVTGVLPSAASPSATGPAVSIPSVRRANRLTRLVAVSVTGGAVAVALLVVAGAIVVPRGRRRHWRPGRIDPQVIDGRPVEAGSDWGDDGPPRAAGTAPDAGSRSLPAG